MTRGNPMATKLYTDKDENPMGARISDAERKKQGMDKPKENGLAARYWREIERYNRETTDWHQEGEEIEKVYLDETRVKGSSSRKFPLLWANVEVLKPAVYSKTPTILCSRRYRDKDRAGRIAAELMERASNTTFELYNVDEVLRMVRDDRLLPGRGTAWVRYEPTIEQYEIEGEIDEDGEPVMGERLKAEKVCVDYVNWQDFGHNVAKTWAADVWLVWRICYKTQEEVEERFGPDVAAGLSYNSKPPGSDNSKAGEDPDSRAKIYELWDKRRNLVSWMPDGKREFLESGPPPLDFTTFFPCPEPCYATKTSKSLIPKPDYRYYRDQAKEINDLTEKIGNMSQWLIVKGFVPSGPSSVADPIEEALNDKSNRELWVKVDSMTEWTERGGASRLIDWLPLEQIQKALQGAISIRNQLIQDVFQITGISDILRGQSDPNETLGAQELKAQTGTKRLRNTRDEVARFARDIGRLVAEVIAEQFSPKSIAEITGYKYVPTPPPMPVMPMLPGNVMPMRPGMPMASPMAGGMPPAGMMMRPGMPPAGGAPMGHNGGPEMGDDETDTSLTFSDDVIELLRNDRLRSFRIDVETDSTIQADENAEKQARMEFLNVAVGALERAAKIMQAAPDLAPVMNEMVMFAARGMRVGKGLEDIMERAMRKAQKRMEAALAQPKENPMVQLEQAKLQQKAQSDQAELALKARGQQQEAQLEIRQQDIDAKLETRKQDIARITDLRQERVAADAQARDRAAQLLQGLQPSGTG